MVLIKKTSYSDKYHFIFNHVQYIYIYIKLSYTVSIFGDYVTLLYKRLYDFVKTHQTQINMDHQIFRVIY